MVEADSTTTQGLLAELEALASAAVDRTVTELYSRHPQLLERFGPAGRKACREDTEHHLEFLASAIAADTPQPFVAYIRWLKALLEARQVPAGSLRESLDVLAEYFHAHASPALAQRAEGILADAREAFDASADSSPTPLLHTPDANLPLERLVSSLVRGRHGEILDLVRSTRRDAGVYADFAVHVIQPAMYEIGRLWHEGRLSVAQEHLATATSVYVLGKLLADQPFAEPTDKTAVVACVETNEHTLGARMISDALMIAGWDVAFLGANTPSRDLVEHIDRTRPDLVALSISMPHQLDKVRRLVERIRAEMEASTPMIMAGGLATNQIEGIWKTFGVDIWTPNVELAMAELA